MKTPTAYTFEVRDAYGSRWWGPYRSLAEATRRIGEEMSPRREGKRSAVLYRASGPGLNVETPIAKYQLVPRMVLRVQKGDGAWKSTISEEVPVENPGRAKPRKRARR